jgi:tetratricopeptide (TPR) repeat protein
MHARIFAAGARLGRIGLLALVAGACSTTREVEHDVDWLVQHGRYEEAVRLAAERHQAQPDDAAAAEEWRMATVALLLDQGRRLSFQKRDLEALERFDQALAVAPDVVQAQHWREAALDKLVDQWIEKAIEFHASDNLAEASRCYEQALEYRADEPRAKHGLGRVLIQLNHRRGMGDKYYQEGIQALDQYWLDQASHHFSATQKYDRDHERAADRRTRADTLRADERVSKAIDLEDMGQFAAARNEYRLATIFDPQHEDALAGLARAKKEERAAEYLRESSRRVLHRQFDQAEAALDAGLALTERQAEAFGAERERVMTARLQLQYDAARALEFDKRYDDAIVAYADILARSPQGFFADTLARKDSLEDFVRRASEAYDAAQAATDPAQKLVLLQQVLLLHPEYKDAKAQLEALEAELPEPTEKPR